MPIYRYTAINKIGERKKGKHEASNEESVKEYIKSIGFHPLKIEKRIGDRKISFGKQIGIKDIAIFCRQFYVMLDAGLPIIRCIEIIKGQMLNHRFREVLDAVYNELQKGRELSTIIADYTKDFPELLVHMIKVGETTGSLDVIMERMAIHFEREFEVTNKIKNAMRYPIFLLLVTGAMLVVIFTFVLPSFIGIYDTINVELPLPTRMLIAMNDSVRNVWYLYVGVILSIILLFKKLVVDSKNNVLDRLYLKIPIVNKTIRDITSSRLARTMSILFASGVSLTDVLDISKKLVKNNIVEKGLEEAKYETQKGNSLSKSIESIKFFDPIIISMIAIGEETGAMDTVLSKAANFFDQEAEHSIEKLITMIEPMMIIFIAVIVGFIVLSVALPMFSMMGSL